MKTLLGAAALILVAAGAWWAFRPAPGQQPMQHRRGPAITAADFVEPDLTGTALIGKRVFDAKCAACHGQNALGTDQGPPLLHPFYLPGHHGDAAFLIAAQQGVRAHHWQFGNMPPVEGVTQADVKAVVAYVRTLQQANGMMD